MDGGALTEESQQLVMIPPMVAQQVGMLHLQLASANERIMELTGQLTECQSALITLRAEKEGTSVEELDAMMKGPA